MTYDLGGNVSSTKGDQFATISNVVIQTPLQSSYGQVGALTLTQPLLKNFWIDKTRLNVRVAKNRLQYSEQGLREQLITSVTAVENAYYELIYAQENVQVQQEALRPRADAAGPGPAARADRHAGAIERATGRSAGRHEQGEFDRGANHAVDIDENTLKNLFTDDYGKWHDTDIQPTATLARRRCNCSICRTVGTRA